MWTRNKAKKGDDAHWVVTFSGLFLCAGNGLLFWSLSFKSQNNFTLGDVRVVWTRSVLGWQCETQSLAFIVWTDVDLKLFLDGSWSARADAALQVSKFPP